MVKGMHSRSCSRVAVHPVLLLVTSFLAIAAPSWAQVLATGSKIKTREKVVLHFHSQPGPALTLIAPGDPGFEREMELNFPSYITKQSYASMKPFLVILRNDTPKVVRAYEIAWDLASPASTAADPLPGAEMRTSAITTPLDLRHPGGIWQTDQSIRPGEERLVSPVFSGRRGEANTFDARGELGNLPAQDTYSAVSPKVDCVVYGDGTSYGPNHDRLLMRYFITRDAQHDEALTLLRHMRASMTDIDLRVNLQRRVNIGESNTHPNRDAMTVYIHERAVAARQFQTILDRAGHAMLEKRLQGLVQLMPPHEKFTTLAGYYHHSKFQVNGSSIAPLD